MPFSRTSGRSMRCLSKSYRLSAPPMHRHPPPPWLPPISPDRARRPRFASAASSPSRMGTNGYGSTHAASTVRAVPSSRRLSTPCSHGMRTPRSAMRTCTTSQAARASHGATRPSGGASGSPAAGRCRSSSRPGVSSSSPGTGKCLGPRRASPRSSSRFRALTRRCSPSDGKYLKSASRGECGGRQAGRRRVLKTRRTRSWASSACTCRQFTARARVRSAACRKRS